MKIFGSCFNLEKWNEYFNSYSKYIGKQVADEILSAKKNNKTAIILFSKPSPIEDDISLLEVWQSLVFDLWPLIIINRFLRQVVMKRIPLNEWGRS